MGRAEPVRPGRRAVLAALAGGIACWLGARPASATPLTMAMAMKESFGETPINPGKVKLDIPAIAESGNAVPLTVSVESPMTASDYVVGIFVFSERNPLPAVGQFQLGPGNGRAQVSTRIRLATSQRLIGVARLSDGTLWSGTAEVVVTQSACGE